MDSDIKNTVTDLMGYLLCELKSRNMPVSHFNMQKLIYKIKMELGEDHELYSKLPYYWYLKGPYSDVVCEVFDDFSHQCVSIGESLLLKDNFLNNYCSLKSRFCEVEDKLNIILHNKDFFYNELDKDIYRNHAPYGFMLQYKYEIYDVAKNENSVNFDICELIGILYHCEGNLPVDSYFNEFNSLYSILSINLDLIFSAGNFEKYWDFLRKPIMAIWETFAKGVRVKFRDDFYEIKLDEWYDKFNKSLIELSKLVNQTEALIDYGDYDNEDYTPEEIKMLNTTIGSYLRRL